MKSSRYSETIKAAWSLLLVGFVGIVLSLGGCSTTDDPSLFTRSATVESVGAEPSAEETEEVSSTAPVLEQDVVANSAAPTDVVQLPVEKLLETPTPTVALEPGGVLPSEAQSFREANLDPATPAENRPPPVPVPHAIHPDDHYWLARPIASDKRNYDLEWYRYGNRPMLPETLPYRVHHGLDFPNPRGTPIFAAGSGEVVWAGNFPSTRNGVNYYGNTVIIKHDWTWQGKHVYTLYAHTLELFVERGDYVETGQLIAGVGASGEVSGPHLHLEVRVGQNSYESTRNPSLWLAPYDGYGTLAGRFMDSRGLLIHGAHLSLVPISLDHDLTMPIQRQRTYEPGGINPDDIWQENFVFPDLPAGEYRLVARTAGAIFRRIVTIKPGQTNYVILQADFIWVPTNTPTPTSTPTPALTLTGTPTPSQ